MSARPRVRSLVTGAIALATITSVLPVASAGAETTAQTVLECEGVGQAKATIAGDLSKGGSIAISDTRLLTVEGQPGFEGTDAAGAKVAIAPSAQTVRCTGEPVTDVELGSLLPAEQVPEAQRRTRVSGHLVVGVRIDQQRLTTRAEGTTVVPQNLANDPAGYGPVEAIPFAGEMSSWLNSRAGNVAVAYRPTGSKTIYSQYKGSATNVTASMVKASIMATVMRRAQEQGRGLTQWEKDQLYPMIKVSDNDAATRLWNHVGGGPEVARVIGLMGLRSTTMGPGGYWGLTVTNAPDQVVLMDHFARTNPVLSDGMRAYGRQLMTSASLWGVTAGPGTSIWLKNGWLPRTDGWHVNSAGHNPYTPGSYSIAVLSHAATSLDTQKATIEGASRLVYKHRNDRLAPPYAPGDWSGDGRADMIGVKDGSLWTFANRAGQLSAPTAIPNTSGWGGATWLADVSDINNDRLPDMLVRFGDGSLYWYTRTASGSFSRKKVGQGWGTMTAITASGDFDGNGIKDILARDASGYLWWYSMDRYATITKRGRIGNGWNGMKQIVLAKGINADGRADVVAVDGNGLMYAWPSTGRALGNKVKLGWGWKQDKLVNPGDLTGDGRDELVYVAPGLLRSYRTTGSTTVARIDGDNGGTSADGFTLLA